MRSVLRPMVKYGPAGGRGHRVHILETETLLRPPCLWLGGSAPQSTTFSAVPRTLISRERVPKSNTGKYKERGNSDPKNMSAIDRIEEFPGENLFLRGGKLFCNGCKEILSSRKTVTYTHLTLPTKRIV